MLIGYHPHSEKLIQKLPLDERKIILTRDPWNPAFWEAQDISGLCWPMHAIPLSGVPGFRISALSYRVRRSAILSIPKVSIDRKQDFHLKTESIVQTRYPLYAFQLLGLRPDIRVELLDLETENDPEKAFIGHHQVVEHTHHLHLHPGEMVPVSALGFYGWATRDQDEQAHLLVRNFHYPESIWCNNLERGLARRWEEYRVGVHVRQENNLLQVWMAGADQDDHLIRVSASFISQAGVEDHMNLLFSKQIEFIRDHQP
ncbi:MAG: hypothetical protein KDC28_07575 [Saprospiraceae bacterium]|nr:hypothetical protein [Saprospiraceae bacterium]MCB9318401.1 hypothetical protein [Lewinellaceae bacterium]